MPASEESKDKVEGGRRERERKSEEGLRFLKSESFTSYRACCSTQIIFSRPSSASTIQLPPLQHLPNRHLNSSQWLLEEMSKSRRTNRPKTVSPPSQLPNPQKLSISLGELWLQLRPQQCPQADQPMSSAVVVKLLLFTLAMITAPLLTYYISVTSVFVGTSRTLFVQHQLPATS